MPPFKTLKRILFTLVITNILTTHHLVPPQCGNPNKPLRRTRLSCLHLLQLPVRHSIFASSKCQSLWPFEKRGGRRVTHRCRQHSHLQTRIPLIDTRKTRQGHQISYKKFQQHTLRSDDHRGERNDEENGELTIRWFGYPGEDAESGIRYCSVGKAPPKRRGNDSAPNHSPRDLQIGSLTAGGQKELP